MSDPQIDPAGNTQQFRAFAQQNERETAAQKRPSYTVPIVIAAVVVVIVAIGAFLLLS